MRFSTISVVLTTGAMIFAGAAVKIPAKRSLTDVLTACVTNLTSEIGTIITELDNCLDNTCTDIFVGELNNALGACDTALGTLPSGSESANGTVADTIANGIIVSLDEFLRSASLYSRTPQGIAEGLDKHEINCASNCTDLSTAYASIDSSLSVTLLAAFDVFIGMKALVVAG